MPANKNRAKKNNAFNNGTANSVATFGERNIQPETGLPQPTNNGGDVNNGLTTPGAQLAAESPLRVFGQAKDKINTIYRRLGDCVESAHQFYSDKELDAELVANNTNAHKLVVLKKSIEIIRGVLSRNQMKVAFFGRTSNGKSTAINAILHDKVLPTGYGHTTNCFLQIQGTREPEGYLEVSKDKDQQQKDSSESNKVDRSPIQSVSHIANALNAGVLEYSTLVKIYWPISKCPLLQYDVVLVDSPGVDVEENLDKWIDEHCHDADVFVLVSNAESTLNIAEKNFFHKVSEKLSKPSLFVLNNRWDAIAEEPDCIDIVRKQHIDRSVQFLSDELKILDHSEAIQRTFFVSSKEILQARMGIQSESSTKVLGYEERCKEFVEFEQRFEECLSKSAVRTKFKKHTDKGKVAINELTTILLNTHDLVLSINKRKVDNLQTCQEQAKNIDTVFYKRRQDIYEQMMVVKRNILNLSAKAFEHEISRLSRVMDDFDEEFVPNYDRLRDYKERLYNHVEEALSENIRNKFNKVVKEHVNPFIEEMTLLGSLLPKQRITKVNQALQSKNLCNYDEMFNLKTFRHAYDDFQEDLEFRCSLGLGTIMRLFRRPKPVAPPNNSAYDASEVELTQARSADGDMLAVVERFILLSPQSPTTVLPLAIGGILVRVVGLRVILATTALYGAFYFYEYLTWTNSAKKRAFKKQFVRHAKSRLHANVSFISEVVASSAEQRLVSCFDEVGDQVESEKLVLDETISALKSGLNKLIACEKFSRELLCETDFLGQELMAFANLFLQ